MTIREVFHPAHDFLGEYFNLRPLFAAGDPDRFMAADPAGLGRALELDLEAPVRLQPGEWRGLPLERGSPDLLILQLTGEDGWRTYGNQAEAAAEPELAARLSAGGALYIPRGWWRSADAGMASRNLRFHIENPTGADFLEWLLPRLAKHPAIDVDIPRFAAPGVRADVLTGIRRTVAAALQEPLRLERFRERLNEYAPAGPFGAGWTGDSAPSGLIAFASRRPRIWRRDSQTVFIRAGGRELLFPADAAPLLQFVIDRAPVPAAGFFAEFDGEFDRSDLLTFLSLLSRSGVIE